MLSVFTLEVFIGPTSSDQKALSAMCQRCVTKYICVGVQHCVSQSTLRSKMDFILQELTLTPVTIWDNFRRASCVILPECTDAQIPDAVFSVYSHCYSLSCSIRLLSAMPVAAHRPCQGSEFEPPNTAPRHTHISHHVMSRLLRMASYDFVLLILFNSMSK